MNFAQYFNIQSYKMISLLPLIKLICIHFQKLFRANIAAAAGGIIFFMLYLPYSFMVVWEEKLDPNAKVFSVSYLLKLLNRN